MNAIGYVRKSTKDQSNYSLEYQENSIRDYCRRNQVELGQVYIDDGQSSYTFDRPDYMALETFIKEHKRSVKYLVILDHDRFSRNLPEALMKIEQLEKKFGLKVVATNEALDIDPDDPSVFMMRAFKYLVANQELFTIRRRAKLGIRQANESGRFVNRAPFGYINGKDPYGKKSLLVVDEKQAYIIKKIFREFLSGIPAYLIHIEARKLGFPLSGREAIVRVIRNSVYAGLVKVNGTDKAPEKFIKGVHVPIIPEEQYWRAQELVNVKRYQMPQPKKEFPLRGILRSPCCGGTMTAGWSKGKQKYYIYYRCNVHSNVNISGAMLHDMYDELIRGLSFRKEQIDEIISLVTYGISDVLDIREKEAQTNRALLLTEEKKLANLEDKLMENVIGDETYKRGYKKIAMEIARLRSQVAYLSEDITARAKHQLSLLPHLLNLPAIFSKSNINQQHSILNRVFKDGLTFKEGMFRTPWINPHLMHNYLILNEKRLLFLEQPSQDLSKIPFSGLDGTRTLNIYL